MLGEGNEVDPSAGDFSSGGARTVSGNRDRSRNFAEIFRWLQPRLVRFMVLRVPPEQAAELAGETLFIVWRKRADVGVPAGDPALAGLAYRIADGLVKNALRADRRHRRLLGRLQAASSVGTSPERDVAVRIAESDEAARVLAALSDGDRTLVGLVIAGLATPAIAEVLGISEGAVRMRISRVRKRMGQRAVGDDEEVDHAR